MFRVIVNLRFRYLVDFVELMDFWIEWKFRKVDSKWFVSFVSLLIN